MQDGRIADPFRLAEEFRFPGAPSDEVAGEFDAHRDVVCAEDAWEFENGYAVDDADADRFRISERIIEEVGCRITGE